MLLTVPSERVEKAKNPPAQQETQAVPSFHTVHIHPLGVGCGERRRNCHFFGLWFAAMP